MLGRIPQLQCIILSPSTFNPWLGNIRNSSKTLRVRVSVTTQWHKSKIRCTTYLYQPHICRHYLIFLILRNKKHVMFLWFIGNICSKFCQPGLECHRWRIIASYCIIHWFIELRSTIRFAAKKTFIVALHLSVLEMADVNASCWIFTNGNDHMGRRLLAKSV